MLIQFAEADDSKVFKLSDQYGWKIREEWFIAVLQALEAI